MDTMIYTSLRLKDIIKTRDNENISVNGIEIRNYIFENTLSNEKKDNLRDYVFKNCTFINCVFNSIEISNLLFIDCKFVKSRCVNIKIHDTIFLDCKFKNCNFMQLELEKINITLCNFKDNKFHKIKSQENIYISTSNFK